MKCCFGGCIEFRWVGVEDSTDADVTLCQSGLEAVEERMSELDKLVVIVIICLCLDEES